MAWPVILGERAVDLRYLFWGMMFTGRLRECGGLGETVARLGTLRRVEKASYHDDDEHLGCARRIVCEVYIFKVGRNLT